MAATEEDMPALPIRPPKPGELPHLDPAFFDWKPSLMVADLWAAFSDWLDLREREREMKPGDDITDIIVGSMIVDQNFSSALRTMAVQGRMWRMDVRGADEIMGWMGGLVRMEHRAAINKLKLFIHQFQDEAEAQWRVAHGEGQVPAKGRRGKVHTGADPISVALAMKTRNPNLSDRQIAQSVGIHPSKLSRSEVYQRVKRVCVGRVPSKGWKDGGTGAIEASDE